MTGATPYLLTSVVAAAVPTAVVVPVLSNKVSKVNEEKDKVKRELNDARDPGSNYFKQNFQDIIKNYYSKNESEFNQTLNTSPNKCYKISDERNNGYWICYTSSTTHSSTQ